MSKNSDETGVRAGEVSAPLGFRSRLFRVSGAAHAIVAGFSETDYRWSFHLRDEAGTIVASELASVTAEEVADAASTGMDRDLIGTMLELLEADIIREGLP